MDFDLNEQQSEILNGLEQLLGAAPVAPPHEGAFVARGQELEAMLAEGGYLDVVAQGLDLIDGALIVDRLARVAVTVEAAASILVAPATGLSLPRPFALASGSLDGAVRFLPGAQTLLVDVDDKWLAVRLAPDNIESLETLFAYPYGRLRSVEGLEQIVIDQPVAAFHRRWRIAMAVEAGGLMSAALDLVVEHVSTRRAFGKAIGSFQAVQHRLAAAAEVTEATRWLALMAAWSDDDIDASVAATYAQDMIPRFCNDLHQFSGAMGLTLEYPLHYFTYRLRALLGELGGGSRQSRALAQAKWAAA